MCLRVSIGCPSATWERTPLACLASGIARLGSEGTLEACAPRLLPGSASLDAVKIFFAANEEPSVSDRNRSAHRFAERVGAEDFVLRASLDDEGLAIVAR